MKIFRVIFTAVLAVSAMVCHKREACRQACANSYESCMQRIADSEKCLFFRQDCEMRCDQ